MVNICGYNIDLLYNLNMHKYMWYSLGMYLLNRTNTKAQIKHFAIAYFT